MAAKDELHPHLSARISLICAQLVAAFEAGASLSAASRGLERELLVERFLDQVFSGRVRFGTGDVCDSHGHKTGQVDVVIETPHLFAFRAQERAPALYLAEGVAGVIEVKSDLTRQWPEVREKAEQVWGLRRHGGRRPSDDDRMRTWRATLGAEVDRLHHEVIGRPPRASHRPPGHPVLVGPFNAHPTVVPTLAIGVRGWAGSEPLEHRIRLSGVAAAFQFLPEPAYVAKTLLTEAARDDAPCTRPVVIRTGPEAVVLLLEHIQGLVRAAVAVRSPDSTYFS